MVLSSSKLSKGGAEPGRRGGQGAWKTKAWRGLKKFFKLGSQVQATAVELVLRKKGPTPEPGPGAYTGRTTGQSQTHKTPIMDHIAKASRYQTDTHSKATLDPLAVQPQESLVAGDQETTPVT